MIERCHVIVQIGRAVAIGDGTVLEFTLKRIGIQAREPRGEAASQLAPRIQRAGKLQSHLFFLQNKKLPSSVQVKIAGEPEKIVNFETEEGNAHLDARLKKEYAEKHGVKVE